MSHPIKILKEEILDLYREPVVGSSYNNTYGEENIINLVNKYRSLDSARMQEMLGMLADFSKTPDLHSSFVSVGVLYALGQSRYVQEAYEWAQTREDGESYLHHFEIGKSLADHFLEVTPPEPD